MPSSLPALVVVALCQFAGQPVREWSGGDDSWVVLQSRPLAGKYEDISFIDARHGWAISSVGEILHTTDGGSTWALQSTNMGRLRSVEFLDQSLGFAGTVTGTLYRTTDGGIHWEDVTKLLPHGPQGFCGMARSGKTIHAVGRYAGGAADYFSSVDNGRSWSYQDLRPLAQGLVEIVSLSSSQALIGGMARSVVPGSGPATILKSVDGGRTWRTVFVHDGGRGFVWKLFPVSSRIIYAALQSQDGIYRVAKSLDAGETWEVQTVASGRPEGPGVQSVGFAGERIGWVGGLFPGMYGTTDGGRTWTWYDSLDRNINRFEKVGGYLLTASSRGFLRFRAETK